MSEATLLADAMKRVAEARKKVAVIARDLMAELPPFTKVKAEDVLSGDTDRVANLAVNLGIARAELRAAVDECDALKRRAQ